MTRKRITEAEGEASPDVWLMHDGSQSAPLPVWGRGRWNTGFFWLVDAWFFLVRLVRGALSPNEKGSSTSTFRRDMRKEGWTLVEDVDEELVPADQMEFLSPLKDGEYRISGGEMRSRAKKEEENFGQRQAEYLLECQEKIPREQRDFYPTFPGTLWRDQYDRPHVPCLRWGGERWYLSFLSLGSGWDSYGRLLRRNK